MSSFSSRIVKTITLLKTQEENLFYAFSYPAARKSTVSDFGFAWPKYPGVVADMSKSGQWWWGKLEQLAPVARSKWKENKQLAIVPL